MRWANNSDLAVLWTATPGVFASDEIERGPRQGFFEPLRVPALRGPHSGIRCTPRDCDICFGRLVDRMHKESCETAHLAKDTNVTGAYDVVVDCGPTCNIDWPHAAEDHAALGELSKPFGKTLVKRVRPAVASEPLSAEERAWASAAYNHPRNLQFRSQMVAWHNNRWRQYFADEGLIGPRVTAPTPETATEIKCRNAERALALVAALPDFRQYERDYLSTMAIGTMMDYNRDNGDVVRVSRSSEFEFVTMLVSTKQGRDRAAAQAQLAATQARQQAYNVMAAHAQLTRAAVQPLSAIEESVKYRDGSRRIEATTDKPF